MFERPRVTWERALACVRAAVVLALALAFWIPAAKHTRGAFPAPLDDVYIYFDFARATARGCVLCWSEGAGYSSGATSPPYALVLAVAYLFGLRGALLGWFAGALGLAALFDVTGSAARLTRPANPIGSFSEGRAPSHVASRVAELAAVLLVVAVPLFDWTYVSGMETSFVVAILGRALLAVRDATVAPPEARDRAQLKAGLWLGLLAVSRPESAPFALAAAVAVAHAAGSRPLLGSLARSIAPTLVGLGALALVNRALTGEASAAGAVRKLWTSDPYASGQDVAIAVVVNGVRLYTEGFEIALGSPWAARGLFLLALVPAILRGDRRIAVPLVLGAIAALALVTLNKTAPFQNFRYVVPSASMLAYAAAVGLGSLARRGRALAFVGPALVLALSMSAARAFPRQASHFEKSAKNIAEQQVEVGRRLAALDPKPRRVFVGDAGAIPYVSDLPALDGLGLGGYHDLPFARASVHGVPAVVELVERMPATERPDVLAIYDSWWPELGARFGERLFSVRIEDNVICGDPEKTVYRARWDLLEDRAALEAGALERVDVGDLVDEREHALAFTQPHGGYVVGAVHLDADGAPRFDAARVLAPGQKLAFTLRTADSKRARLEVVTDSAEGTTAQISIGDARREAGVTLRGADAWGALVLEDVAVAPGMRVEILAGSGPLRVGSVRVLPSPE
ncbi:MAG: hypothetical protein U0271_33385 [Polyangiaceae bacterium]